MDLKVNENLTERLVRILRLIRMKNTNSLLIGPSYSGKKSIVTLGLYLSNKLAINFPTEFNLNEAVNKLIKSLIECVDNTQGMFFIIDLNNKVIKDMFE